MKKVYVENINDFILVDDEDFIKVNQYKWHMNKSHNTIRFLAWVNNKKIALPYYLTGKVNSYQKVKGYDFRKNNIGIDQHKYRYREPQKNSSSKYKGVRLYKNKWRASITINGKRIHLGSFDKESDAAKAYNMAVVDLWNGNGYLNSV
ncbi:MULTISPECIES: AP2 domain-containing protein [Staphylococcus]|uniref:AP2 domain-containing protein n=1 Tax=Staphylococcus TaxID=1279 RepID=UPI0004518C38|nr:MULTISPECIES: AP2 domain-containing protein [Staphylococcus]MCG2329220.1 AP2 domain-containing protein [Staphylococcus epidermidis]AXS25549.1 AP2 domain-containing protein [Staphylococcus aureus]AXS28289.1 AP2 domain-containing protein [Staphylococcus aureus]EZU56724.1 hypothetical protein U985_02640 [Staphylococcus aureus 1110803248]MBE7397848.1 AP2 domain-containing protein [Staphylococcus aureus]